MAVLSGIGRQYSREMSTGMGFVSEVEWTERIATIVSRIEDLEAGGTTGGSQSGSVYNGGTPFTNHSGNFKIDFGGVA